MLEEQRPHEPKADAGTRASTTGAVTPPPFLRDYLWARRPYGQSSAGRRGQASTPDQRAGLPVAYGHGIAPGRLRGVFLREERPSPGPELVRRAEANCAGPALGMAARARRSGRSRRSRRTTPPSAGVTPVALINGEVSLAGITDVIVDSSARLLSLGVAYPPRAAPAAVRRAG